MKFRFLLIISVLIAHISCGDHKDSHSHGESTSETDEQNHNHEGTKLQFTVYSEFYELFAEADPFVKGIEGNFLAHFSQLSDFKPLEQGRVELKLTVGDIQTIQVLDKPTRKGIYSFDILPETSGKGKLQFSIDTREGPRIIDISDIMVHPNFDDAMQHSDEPISTVNTTVFTKEQSWKVDFKTEYPELRPFGKIIKAVGQVQTPKCEELILTAKNNGILIFPDDHLIEGKKVQKYQQLFTISSSDFVDNNLEVRLQETVNNLDRAKRNLERIKSLYLDKMVLENEYLEAKNLFENESLNLENLNKNFKTGGQQITSPMTGFIKKLYVQNGQYVEVGQALSSIINNRKILITADVDLKNASLLPSIYSVTINNMYDKSIQRYTDLNHSVLTIGQHTNLDNFMIPISLELDNTGNYIPGSFVDLYITTLSELKAVTIPNSAIMEEQGKFYVFLQKTPELFEKKYVIPGPSDGLLTQINEGISVTDRIVSDGAIFIKLAQISGKLDAHAGHVH